MLLHTHTPPSIPPSPLSSLSSPLPRIPSLPLHTSPTYADALLGHRAAMIQLRATSPLPIPSPPLLLPSDDHRSDIPETDMPFQKRLCLTAHASRFEARESLTTSAIRKIRHTLARRVDNFFIDTRQDAHELYVRDKDAQDDRALLRAQISLLTRERQYFRSMTSSYKREAVIAQHAWSHSEDRSMALEVTIKPHEARTTALEAQVRTLQTQHDRMEWQRQDAGDLVTTTFRCIHALEARD
ncbi:hypothetical protein Tco_0292114 [Tanacetum coccineum]